MLTFVSADVKENREGDFLRINDNIQNEALRTELEVLREEFNIERAQIKEYYNEKIETLKGARQNEIKTIKNDFAERRKVLIKKYVGKIRKQPPIGANKPINNAQEQMKDPKDKKKNRKP